MNFNEQDRSNVILSEAKNLRRLTEILRFAQNDNTAQDDRVGCGRYIS